MKLKVGDMVKVLLDKGFNGFRVENLNTGKNVVLDCITISPTSFHVDLKERMKTIDNKKESAHAWVEGEVVNFKKQNNFIKEINYNPYLFDYFYLTKTKEEYNNLDNLINFRSETLKGYTY